MRFADVFTVLAQYSDRGYTVRVIGFFRVGKKFPSLVEADMLPGVGDANYALSVAAYELFRIQPKEVETTVAASSKPNFKRKNRS